MVEYDEALDTEAEFEAIDKEEEEVNNVSDKEVFSFFNDCVAENDFMDGSYDVGIYEHHEELTGEAVSDSWILLDNQSMVHLSNNGDLLTNIREADCTCRVKSTAGVVVIQMLGDLPGFLDPVWYYPDRGIILIVWQTSYHLMM